MTDIHHHGGGIGGGMGTRNQFGGGMGSHYPQQHTSQRAHFAVKAATAVTAGGSLLVLSGLTLAGTVIALTVATPLLYATGGHPPGADSLDQARDKLGYKAREMKGRAEHATGMGQHQGGGGLGMGHHRADM
ncbi:oleosin 1-like protein [Tanacetum coccineum]